MLLRDVTQRGQIFYLVQMFVQSDFYGHCNLRHYYLLEMFFFVMTLLVKSAFNIHEIIVIISVFKVRTSQNF